MGSQIGLLWPSAALWINSNIETITFIYAFTWIFVLSSVIPGAILGKERGVLAQYLVVLTLSLIAFFMPDIIFAAFGFKLDDIVSSATLLQNPFIAVLYLSAPYLFMIGLDYRCRVVTNRKKKTEAAMKENQFTEERLHSLIRGEKTEKKEEKEEDKPKS
jgi:hypothetical protein